MAKYKIDVISIVRNTDGVVTKLFVDFYNGADKLTTEQVTALANKKVSDFSGTSGALKEITGCTFAADSITFGTPQAKDNNILIQIGNGTDFGRTFVNFFEEGNAEDTIAYSYTTPEIAGKYNIGMNGEIGELGSTDHSFTPEITAVDIVAVASDHIAKAVTTFDKPYLIKMINKPLPAKLTLAGAINEPGFGYEIVFSEQKTKDLTEIND